MKSYYDENFYYPVPIFDGKTWIPTEWIEEEDYEKSDKVCGKGLHLMKIPNPKYGRYSGNCYEAEGLGLLGEDGDKARFKKIRLIRPVERKEIFKSHADLSFANLSFANLRSADLSSADLRSANLRYANFLEYSYWNKFTIIDEGFKKLLKKERFLE